MEPIALTTDRHIYPPFVLFHHLFEPEFSYPVTNLPEGHSVFFCRSRLVPTILLECGEDFFALHLLDARKRNLFFCGPETGILSERDLHGYELKAGFMEQTGG